MKEQAAAMTMQAAFISDIPGEVPARHQPEAETEELKKLRRIFDDDSGSYSFVFSRERERGDDDTPVGNLVLFVF
jgi:hypothetical protein